MPECGVPLTGKLCLSAVKLVPYGVCEVGIELRTQNEYGTEQIKSEALYQFLDNAHQSPMHSPMHQPVCGMHLGKGSHRSRCNESIFCWSKHEPEPRASLL